MCQKFKHHSSCNLKSNFISHTTPTQSYLNALMKDVAILDSGATNHYLKGTTKTPTTKLVKFGPVVHLPDGDTMQATHSTSLQIPELSPTGSQAYLFPKLKSANLLSIGQFCDDGCNVNFNKHEATVVKNGKTLLKGIRNNNNGMWETPLPIATSHNHAPVPFTNAMANGIIKKETTVNDLINFFHAACFSPSTSTWINAIRRNYFLGWPGLTVKAVRKYLSPSPSTSKGHLDQTQKNQHSITIDPFNIPPAELDNVKHNVASAAIITLPTGKIYTDQTGKFPVTSGLGNKYVFILYDHDSNAILAETLKSRQGAEIKRAFLKLTGILKAKGLHPKFHILDNEASADLKQAIADQNIKFQLAPPNIHRRNAAERAIRTFKNHLIAGLSSVDKDFPLHQWDQLLEQAVITLNLLRPARINPKLSAYAYLFGLFNYNATPLAPPGIKCQIHEKPNQRKSWAPHSVDGYYLGPAMQHYRCFKVFVTKTNAQRICDTVEFFPTKIRMPETSALEQLKNSVDDLIHVLKTPKPKSPFLDFGCEQSNALQRLAELFSKNLANNQPNSPPHPPPTSVPRVDNSPTTNPVPPPRVNDTNTQHPPTPTPTGPPTEPASISPQQRQVTFHDQLTQTRHLPPATTPNHTKRRSRRLQQARRQTLLLHLATQRKYKDFTLNHIEKAIPKLFAHPVIDPQTGKSLEFRHLINHADPEMQRIWSLAMCKELGRLAQGYKNNNEATNCIEFISFDEIPPDKKPTYARIVAEVREQKADPNRVRITVGGNLIFYPHDKSQPTADITTVKLHINSTISTPGARYACIDIKNMYLNSHMKEPEFMFIDVKYIPQEFMDEYELHDKVHNGKIYVKINKGMYGLPQAGKLAHDQLKAHLVQYGYNPCPLTPGLWKHDTRPISFTLVVDDFGVKYVGAEHLQHLIKALKDAYEITVDMDGKYMLGMTLEWNYVKKHVDISMPNYIENMLKKFFHKTPSKHQAQPHQWIPPAYGQKVQYSHEPTPSPFLSAKDTTRIQQILGTLLYYGRAVDPTMLPAINDIASQQAKPTAATTQHLCQLLDYAASNPNTTIRFAASQMVLHIHSDGSYLSAPCSRSRAAGHFFLSNWPKDITKPDDPSPPTNGPVYTVCKTLRNVMASAAETELGALFYNGQDAIPLRHALIEMGHIQPPTPIATDNTTALGIVTSSIKQKRSKAMDMRFHWVQDRVRQNQFLVYWAPGNSNLADYFSKHHPAHHHKKMRHHYLINTATTTPNISYGSHFMQGCVPPENIHEDIRYKMCVQNHSSHNFPHKFT